MKYVAEYVVGIDEGPNGYRGFEVRAVSQDRTGEYIDGFDDYNEALALAIWCNREELGLTGGFGPIQLEAFANWPDKEELRAAGIINGRVTEARKRQLEKLDELDW